MASDLDATDLDRLVLRSPDALLAALPYLLGFRPAESAVLLWLAEGRLLLTQRLDLPHRDPRGPGNPRLADAWQAAVWSHPAATMADAIVLVLVTDADPDDELVATTVAAAGERAIDVRDVLLLAQGRWRSLLCHDPDCCPPRGRVPDPAAEHAVGAEFALMGRAPLPGRDHVEATLARDPARAEEVARIRPPRRRTGAARERWRDAVLGDLLALLSAPSGPPSAPRDAPAPPDRALSAREAARLLDGLADIRVRDTVLWEAGRWGHDALASAVEALAGLVRAAPPGRCAPAATCLALLCWLDGDGARALMALDRAASDDPSYSLACLVGAAVRAGLPPTAWREAVAGLSREECRHGTDPGLRQAGASL